MPIHYIKLTTIIIGKNSFFLLETEKCNVLARNKNTFMLKIYQAINGV